MLRTFMVVLGAAAMTGLLASSARADLNLTTAGANGFVNGAYFVQIDSTATGTGVINSFVRIQRTGSEQGYNTDGRPVEFNENTSPQFTHSLLTTDVPLVNIDGVNYRQFMLDINQTSANPLLTLSSLRIYLAATGDITSLASLGAAIYDLDGAGASDIYLDYSLNHGSGSGDMFAYIPDALFVGSPYVYLYSQFTGGNDGFEEWAVLGRPVAVPAPGAALLVVLGVSLVGWVKRRLA